MEDFPSFTMVTVYHLRPNTVFEESRWIRHHFDRRPFATPSQLRLSHDTLRPICHLKRFHPRKGRWKCNLDDFYATSMVWMRVAPCHARLGTVSFYIHRWQTWQTPVTSNNGRRWHEKTGILCSRLFLQNHFEWCFKTLRRMLILFECQLQMYRIYIYTNIA